MKISCLIIIVSMISASLASCRQTDEKISILDDMFSRIELNATEAGWQVYTLDNDQKKNLVYEDIIAPECQSKAAPTLVLPANQTISLAFSNYRNLHKKGLTYPQICIEEWGINTELVPGIIHGVDIFTDAPRSVCAICYDVNNNIIPQTTIRFEITNAAP